MARSKRSANTTIRMVAAEAGISESTVSRVMNGRHDLIREQPGAEPVAMFAPRIVLRESTGLAPAR